MEIKKIFKHVKDAKMPLKKVLKYTFVFLAIVLGLIILFVAMKALFVYGLYSFFLGKISATFGLDIMWARLIAVFAVIAMLLALPSIISFFLFGRRKKEVFLIVSMATVVCFLGLYYGTANVFFDRATGKPAKYYIKTLEGFKFSSTGDFDSKFGIRFKPVTPEIFKEYHFWQKTGKLENVPEVRAGKYFDIITGEPIVWYSERPNGEIRLFPLPGYDQMTGQLLKPMTKEMVEAIEKKQAQAELERKKKEEEKKAAEEKRAAEERKKKKEEEIRNKKAEPQETNKDAASVSMTKMAKKEPKAPSPQRILLPGTTFLFGNIPIREKQAQVKNFISSYVITFVSIDLLDDLKPKFTFLIENKSDRNSRVELTEPEVNTHLVDQSGERHPFLESVGFPKELPLGIPIRFSLTFGSIPNTTTNLSITFRIGEWFYYNPMPFSVDVFFRKIELK